MRPWPKGEGSGVIFCATGAGYAALARQAAAECRRVMPGCPIDLYTDCPITDPVFDRVVPLSEPWHRSKIDAMAASRFARTVYLDADTVVRAPFEDVFALLERFDLCGAQDPIQNDWGTQAIFRQPVPAAFPQINTGVLGFRNTGPVRRFLRRWARIVRRRALKKDQAVFRELLWQSDLRFATLPEAYNFMASWRLPAMQPRETNPRILHLPPLNRHLKGGAPPVTPEAVLGPAGAAKLTAMASKAAAIAADTARLRRIGTRKHRPSQGETEGPRETS